MESEYIRREIEARQALEKEARNLLDRAADEGRDLSPEESEQFDKLVAESDRRKARIVKLEAMVDTEAVVAEQRHIIETAAALENPTKTSPDEQITDAIRSAFATYGKGGQLTGEVTFEFQPESRLSFGRLIYDQGEIRALGAYAGITSPDPDYLTRIAVYARTLSPWLGIGTIVNGTDGSGLRLPRITTDPTQYAPGQGTAITESSPVYTAATATPSSYKALAAVSQELAQDEVVGLMDVIARVQGRSIGLAFGSDTTTAVLAGFANGGTAAGTPFFDLDDLIGLIYGRAVGYRTGGVFVMANGAISKVRKFKDSNGQYLWEPSGQAGQPDRLLGHAVYEDPNLATPASATKSVLFGDATEYVIKQLPLRVAVSTEYLFNTDEVAIKTVYRAGGAVRLSDAMAFLVSGNT